MRPDTPAVCPKNACLIPNAIITVGEELMFLFGASAVISGGSTAFSTCLSPGSRIPIVLTVQ
jgi:hypothetical protein